MRRHVMFKRSFTLLLLLALFCWTAFPPGTVSAATPQGKEEVVYATLSPEGSLEEVYVVNSYADLQGTVIDYGSYDTVTALSGQGDLSYQDGKTTIKNGDGPFYYQGELADPVLPWQIQITYTLDGQQVAPENVNGASGLLTSTLQIRPSSDCDPFFFENYALQISIPLDSSQVQNIQAEGATIANSGSTKTLSYIVFPGQETTLSFQADVQDFQLSSIQIAGISLQFSVGEFDLDSLLSGVYQLQDGVAQLDEGAQDLDQGVEELRSGASDLASGLGSVEENLGALRSGLSTLFGGITLCLQYTCSFLLALPFLWCPIPQGYSGLPPSGIFAEHIKQPLFNPAVALVPLLRGKSGGRFLTASSDHQERQPDFAFTFDLCPHALPPI